MQNTNNILQILTIPSSVGLAILLLATQGQERNPAKETNYLPVIQIQLMDSTMTFCTNEIKKNEATIIVYFSPDCEYCHEQIKNMADSINLLNEVKIVFITGEHLDPSKANRIFPEKLIIKNIIIGTDILNSFYKLYNSPSIPYTLFYGKSHRLMSTHQGTTSVKSLIKTLSIINEESN
ncbi:MAG: hypothetical protein DI539_22665 [Flavobacterium psychrophilum]|nr:MAG: hypothetical protein DI539_22665 [Flavobacterium psychrophilum]